MPTALVIGALTSVNILLGFLLQWYVLIAIGPGIQTDALFAGVVVPQLLVNVSGNCLIPVLTPLFSAHLDDDHFEQDVWSFVLVVMALSCCLAFILGWLSRIWVPWIVPGFAAPTQALTAELVRIHFIGMVAAITTGVLASAYNARHRFMLVETAAVAATTFAVGFLIWALPRFGITAAAWAFVLRFLLQSVFLLPAFGPLRRPNLESPLLRTAWRRIKPIGLGQAYFRSGRLIDRFLASMAPAGELSVLHATQQIYGATNQILSKSMIIPAMPALAGNARRNQWRQFSRTLTHRLIPIGIIAVSIFALIVVAGKPLLALVFAHGAFGHDQVELLWKLLIALGGFLIAGSLGNLLSAGLFALGDTKTPTVVFACTYTVGILARVMGFYFFGVIGIAVGNTIHFVLSMPILYILMQRKLAKETGETSSPLET